ncbi:MAG TPA: YibE/F family protein [Thermoleophilaceae bacterium]|nr:YibE/F family protein [Thermoleophilaceae bacterium]
MTRVFSVVVAALALATLAGVVVLWPGEVESGIAEGILVDSERGTVERVEETVCPGLIGQNCRQVFVRPESGPESGKRVQLQLGDQGFDPDVDPGDEVRVTKTPEPPPGAEPVTGTGYSFVDFERRGPMLWLAALFVAAVLLLGRLRGALSLLGLAASLAVVVVFVVPSILDGNSPLAVAVTGSLAIALVTIPLAHGSGPKSLAALLGTAVSLLLTAGLAVLFTELTHLTGLSSEEAIFLQLGQADLSLQGLLLAGIVIGALGVLDDVTISQASTVLALRRANPALGFRELFGRALHVGRDHVSATVNTLVLAYVGAGLPALLLFSAADLSVSEVANFEIVAKEIVATLVGSIGLICAVPITTGLAAWLALNEDPDGLGAEAHAHAN